jgi:hypothetical protein
VHLTRNAVQLAVILQLNQSLHLWNKLINNVMGDMKLHIGTAMFCIFPVFINHFVA